jgi:hypothetical protein
MGISFSSSATTHCSLDSSNTLPDRTAPLHDKPVLPFYRCEIGSIEKQKHLFSSIRACFDSNRG